MFRSSIKTFFGGYDLVFIDEAQQIPGIGAFLKLMVDTLPTLRIIVTGSSSFELAHQVGEPLTGRKKTVKLYPLSVLELNRQFGGMYCEELTDAMLIYGTYPEVLNMDNPKDKSDYLVELRDAALYKDILELDSVRNTKKIADLLRLVAFQVGREVSFRELASQLGMSAGTVEQILDLLEKAFVLINIRGFSRNLRKEISRPLVIFFSIMASSMP
jgi:predicted AAA+ superfamily ATPase